MKEQTENLRGFKIRCIPATDTKGTRVCIEDLRHNKRVYLPYSYDFNSCKGDALRFLENIGILIEYSFESDKEIFLLSRNFEIQIKESA
jgi:hypothetical protein